MKNHPSFSSKNRPQGGPQLGEKPLRFFTTSPQLHTRPIRRKSSNPAPQLTPCPNGQGSQTKPPTKHHTTLSLFYQNLTNKATQNGKTAIASHQAGFARKKRSGASRPVKGAPPFNSIQPRLHRTSPCFTGRLAPFRYFCEAQLPGIRIGPHNMARFPPMPEHPIPSSHLANPAAAAIMADSIVSRLFLESLPGA